MPNNMDEFHKHQVEGKMPEKVGINTYIYKSQATGTTE